MEQHDGILLQSIPYLGNRHILKVFTKDAGLLTLMSRLKSTVFMSPFCRAEWIIDPKGEMHPVKDASLIDPLLHLKADYATLFSAGKIAQDLLKSQWPRKTTQGLYELLLACFRYLAHNPTAIAESFRLKLLQLEGLLHLQPHCARCEGDSSGLCQGESVCSLHGEPLLFQKQEWEQFLRLGLAKRFSELESVQLPASFLTKSDSVWVERLQQ